MTRTCPFSPPPAYEEIREEDSVTRVRLPDGGQAWVVTRLEDVRTVLNDRRFSADRQHPDFPQLVKGGFRRQGDERTMITMDAPEHGPARKAVLGEFTVRRMEALRPRIQEIVDAQIDALLAGPKPGDLVEALSLPVPSLVICEMLGVPYAEHDFFQAHTAKLIKRSTTPEERRAAFDTIRGYMEDLIAEKEDEPAGRPARPADRQAPRGRHLPACFAGRDRLPAAGGRARDDGEHDLAVHRGVPAQPGAARGDQGRPGQDARRRRGDAALLDDRRRGHRAPVRRGRRGRRAADPGRRRRAGAGLRGEPGPAGVRERRRAGHRARRAPPRRVRLRAAPVPRPEPGPDGAADRLRHALPPHPDAGAGEHRRNSCRSRTTRTSTACTGCR